MGLVEYSDSDGSDAEDSRVPQPSPKGLSVVHKPAFQKVVDRSNPHKIRVNLPAASNSTEDDIEDNAEPPSKRVKVGPTVFSGFNSLLPPPKKIKPTNAGTTGKAVKNSGLGSGVNLKTGATPGFIREEVPRTGGLDGANKANEDEITEDTAGFANGEDVPLHEPKPASPSSTEPKIQGNHMMFKPLSVTRKSKKCSNSMAGTQLASNQDLSTIQQPRVTPKVSLFSIGEVRELQGQSYTTTGDYQPMIYQPSHSKLDPPLPYSQKDEGSGAPEFPNGSLTQSFHTIPNPSPQSLDTIASDLNLSASAKRQLLGRQRSITSNINIVNFNTDREYATNELLRQAGEQVQHNPVRAIAPGKHNLKQLVNAANSQKDALEEQFALGRRNRKEAGGKYGW